MLPLLLLMLLFFSSSFGRIIRSFVCETTNTHTTYDVILAKVHYKNHEHFTFCEECKMEIIKFSLCSYYFTWALWYFGNCSFVFLFVDSILSTRFVEIKSFSLLYCARFLFLPPTYHFTLCTISVSVSFFSLISAHLQKRRQQPQRHHRQRHTVSAQCEYESMACAQFK